MESEMAMIRKTRGGRIMRERVRVAIERRYQASTKAFEDACIDAFADAVFDMVARHYPLA